MDNGEKIWVSKRSPVLIMVMGVIFVSRGFIVFPRHQAHPFVTIFDILALFFTGLFLAILTIRKYSKISIFLLGLSWFLNFFPWLWYLIFFPFFLIYLGLFGVELLFPLIVITSLFTWLFIWKKLKKANRTYYYSVYLEKFKLQPETFVALIIVILIILAIPLPRLSYNSIIYNYEGEQDVLDHYLQLEFNQYFPEIDSFLIDTCTGWPSFDLVPNFIGSTGRISYANSVLSSKYKVNVWMEIAATTNDTLLGQEIFQEADDIDYLFGFWNNSFQDLTSADLTYFNNMSWGGETIHIIREFIRWDNMVGTDMRFHQFVAFFPLNNSIITILSGYQIACYD